MCMSRWVSHTQAIKSIKLRWKIPKNFPDKHRPSNGLYLVIASSACTLFVFFPIFFWRYNFGSFIFFHCKIISITCNYKIRL